MWFFLSLLFLIVAAWVFIHTPFGQNWITQRVTARLSRDLHTRIQIKHVDFALFNAMELQGVLVEDQQRDTILSAREVTVRITDWFFFKDNVVLKYVGISDAVIKLQRTDSVWAHQFIVDYFTSPSDTKSDNRTHLDLKKVEMKNITLVRKDAWLGQDMTVSFRSLNLDAREFDLAKKRIGLDALTIETPNVAIYEYAKRKPIASTVVEANESKGIDSSLEWNAAGWIVDATKFQIIDGVFRTDRKEATTILPYFDGKHIYFKDINTTLTGVHWEKDTVLMKLDLKATERSGLVVKQMNADAKLTPREMEFNDLDLHTNNSIVRNYFRMSYDDFGDMGNFIHAVMMHGKFDNATIDSDDIAFFAPAASTWKKNLVFDGSVRGTVDDLFGKDLLIQAGRNTLLNGDISMTGLPDITQTFIDFKANDFRTTYDDALSFVPDLRRVTSPDLRKLQYLKFNGSFTGFIRDFVTFGTLQTALGTVKSDLNMKLPISQAPVYSGTIATDNFRLGEFINDPNIGAIALNGTLKGRGFDPDTRKSDIDGKIKFIDYNGYRYNNITLNGKLDKKRFEGIASIDDPEVEFTLNGLIDFNLQTPAFNFLADVSKAHLKSLHLTDEDIQFNGKFNLDFTGDNIDNFMGSARITDALLTRNGSPLPFDSLTVSSTFANNMKTISARSNEFEANVAGDFNIRDLPNAFRLFLNRYYPAYIKAPTRMPENESLSFDITTNYVDDYVRLIDSSLSGFDNSHIYGSLNTAKNEMNLRAEIPQFKYDRYNFDDVKLTAKGTRDSLSLFGGATNIIISDSLNVPLALFRIDAHNDSSKVRIYTGANQAINQANLNALVLTYNNGVKIDFDPSTFVVNSKTWTIEESGELEFRKNTPASGQLVLKESNQEIRLKTRPSETGDWNDLVVELKRVNLGDFSPFFMPHNRLEGLVSGTVSVENPTSNMYVSSNDLKAEGLRLDNDSIGDASATMVYDSKTKKLKAKGTTLDPSSSLAFDLDLNLGSRELQKSNVINLQASTYQLSILQRFLGGLFSNIRGYVTGNFQLLGELDKLQITGKGRLKDAGLKVNFTQCFYKIQDTELELRQTEIPLDGMVLTDSVTNNPIYLSGSIQHESFRNMFFDLTVSTRKPKTTGPENNRPVLLLNTDFNDNKQFFGRVKGTGSFSLSGPESEMFMKIDAIASTTDSSSVTIPSFKSRESGIADFLVERKYGHEMTDAAYTGTDANVTYDVDVTANPMVTVKVILDELTGDKIEGRGSGTLNIHAGSTEKMQMHGRFDIQEGNYLFTFQSFFKKPFAIRKGADNYITWSGDPVDAKIKFEAVYTAENVSFAPLVQALGIEQTYSRLRDDVYVIVNLSGDLFQPAFAFKLDFPSSSKALSDFSVASNIQQMEKNPNEINRQVTYLIVFNSFAPPEYAATTGIASAVNEFTYNTISSISGIFFNEINKKLNTELMKILKTDNISINFSGSVYNRNPLTQQSSTGFNINQSNFNVNVPISLFKDRFVVTLGSTLDVPLQATIQQNVQFLPDVTAEWLINEKGTIRASFFYRQNLDYLTSNTSGAARTKRSGASIAYRKEFDSLGEFLGRKKEKKKKTEKTPDKQEKEVGENKP